MDDICDENNHETDNVLFPRLKDLLLYSHLIVITGFTEHRTRMIKRDKTCVSFLTDPIVSPTSNLQATDWEADVFNHNKNHYIDHAAAFPQTNSHERFRKKTSRKKNNYLKCRFVL